MKELKITQGNDFVIYLPLVILNSGGAEAVDTSNMTDVVVKVKRACAAAITVVPTYVDNNMVLSFPDTMELGDYDADIRFKLLGVDKSVQINKFFGIVEYDYQSNWRDFIVGDHVVHDTQAFIAGVHYTNAQYEALKAQLVAKIAEVDALKAEWLAKVAELTGIAKEANATLNKQAILDAIANIDLSTLAKQGNDATATMTALKALIQAIPTTPITGYALQGTNSAATNTAIYAELEGISDDYADQLEEIIGITNN